MKQGMIRGIIKSVTEGLIKIFSATGRTDESFDQREYFQHYGYTSRPLEGAEVIIIREGNHILAIASDDRRYRIGLENGEVAIYTDEGDNIHLKRNKIIEVNSGNKIIANATNEVDVNTKKLVATATDEADVNTKKLVATATDEADLSTKVAKVTATTSCNITSPVVTIAAETSCTINTISATINATGYCNLYGSAIQLIASANMLLSSGSYGIAINSALSVGYGSATKRALVDSRLLTWLAGHTHGGGSIPDQVASLSTANQCTSLTTAG